MNRKLLPKIFLVTGILIVAFCWLQPYPLEEQAEDYSQQKLSQIIRTLPMDSSVAIIFDITGLLTPACIPKCWPRDFTMLESANQHIAYVMTRLYHREAAGRTDFEKSKHNFSEVDSSFYSLINEATINYEAITQGKVINAKDVRALNNKRVTVGVIDGLKGEFLDNDLGYVQLSPVITNERGDKGVFFYKILGEFMTSWLICVRRVNNEWVIVSKSRLAIS